MLERGSGSVQGFAKVILERSLEDSGFISTFTKGYEDYEKWFEIHHGMRSPCCPESKKRNTEDWEFDCEVESHNLLLGNGPYSAQELRTHDTRNLQPSSAWRARWKRRGWIVPS